MKKTSRFDSSERYIDGWFAGGLRLQFWFEHR